MKRIFINETISKVGEKVKVSGWVNVRRDHGKIIFIDLRDISGLLQVVFANPMYDIKDASMSDIMKKAEQLEILNEAKTPPFEIGEKYKVNEELRMEYRYLDLRDSKMQKNLMKRSK